MDMGTQDNKKYQAVIFDPIFDTDDLDLNNIQCNLTHPMEGAGDNLSPHDFNNEFIYKKKGV